MIKKGQKIEVEWHQKNKDYYISKGYKFTKYGDIFLVDAEDINSHSKIKIKVICDLCLTNDYEITIHGANKSKEHVCDFCKSNRGKICSYCKTCGEKIVTTKGTLNKSKSGYLFCSNKCVGRYNAIVKDRKIKKTCKICKKSYHVKRTLASKSVACSKDCHSKWQSIYLRGENANNYKGGNRFKICKNCNKKFYAGTPYKYKTRIFCGLDCKHDYWIKNTLSDDKFIKNRYKGIITHRKIASSKGYETLPEKMTRKHFESLGFVKGVDFFQEEGVLGKYVVDFYFPSYKLIVEVMGDYWHGNPEVYGDGKIPLDSNQKEIIKKDKIRKKYFIDAGFTYIELWEKDIYEDINGLIRSKCLKYIPVTTTRRTSNSLDCFNEMTKI